MAEIFDWIKRLICLSIFLTLLLQVLPDGSYRKYVKFFAGLVFVVTVMSPAMHILLRDDWEEALASEAFAGEKQREIALDFDYMEEKQRELYEKSMKETIDETVRSAAEKLDVEVRDVSFGDLDAQGGFEMIRIRVRNADSRKREELRESVADLLPAERSRVEVTEI